MLFSNAGHPTQGEAVSFHKPSWCQMPKRSPLRHNQSALAPRFRSALGTTLVVAVAAVFSQPASVQAAGLGKLSVHSSLGQTLSADIDVPGVEADETASLQVHLASAAAFKEANLDLTPVLSQLKFDLLPVTGGGYAIHVSSATTINEPYLDLLVELSWAGGRVLREYTLLLDPPKSTEAPAPIVPAATEAPAPVPVDTAPAPASAPAASSVPVPSAAAVATTPATVPAAPTVTPTPAAPAAATPQPAPLQPASPPPATPKAPRLLRVAKGNTLAHIASANLPADISLDQMLIGLLQANPTAFVQGNVNRLLAGAQLVIPDSAQIAAINASEAHKQVIAQSQEFASYRSRLAQLAQAVAPVAPSPSAATGTGKIHAQVEDKSPAVPNKGDTLKVPGAAPGQSALSSDEKISRDQAIKEQQDRIRELTKINNDLKKANEQMAHAKDGAISAPAPVATQPKPSVATPQIDAVPAPPPKPLVKQAPPVPAPSLFDRLTTVPVISGVAVVLALLLLGLNFLRRRREAYANAAGRSVDGHSLFGAIGGQSVDTSATSSFNSSFIPATSQLDINDVDPVAEADVYIAYGREEQAEEILKEALRVQPERVPVRIKLLEIYARRADAATFAALAQEFHAQTSGLGEDWQRVAKMGRALDPQNKLYGDTGDAFDLHPLSPVTQLHGEPASEPEPYAAATVPGEFEEDSLSHMMVEAVDFDAPHAEHNEPKHASGNEPAAGPASAAAPAPTLPEFGLDFGALDFDLGPSRIGMDPTTRQNNLPSVVPASASELANQDDDGDDLPDMAQNSSWPTVMPMPDIDLNLTPAKPVVADADSDFDDPLFKPTMLREFDAAEQASEPKLSVNSEQATVPLIDFDLLPNDESILGAQTQNQFDGFTASQMATKLDLARGYIDLGVKDGARELLEEVMKDGTREQRQQAVELIKLIDA